MMVHELAKNILWFLDKKCPFLLAVDCVTHLRREWMEIVTILLEHRFMKEPLVYTFIFIVTKYLCTSENWIASLPNHWGSNLKTALRHLAMGREEWSFHCLHAEWHWHDWKCTDEKNGGKDIAAFVTEVYVHMVWYNTTRNQGTLKLFLNMRSLSQVFSVEGMSSLGSFLFEIKWRPKNHQTRR